MNFPEHTPDLDDDLPPSAKYIIYVLEDAEGSLPRGKLKDRTGLAETTLSEALTRLDENDVIYRDRRDGDLRFVLVKLAENS